MVHLKRGDKVDHNTKFTILLSLMEPLSPAYNILEQFENCTDMEEAYLFGVHQLWREYGSDNEKLASSAKVGLKDTEASLCSKQGSVAICIQCGEKVYHNGTERILREGPSQTGI